MATPAAVQTITTNSVISNLDLLKPEKSIMLTKRFGNQSLPYFNLLKALGRTEMTSNEVFSHFEEDRWIEVAVVAAPVASPGAGNDIQFTLDASSLNAQNQYYPDVLDVITFPNEVTGIITAIDTTVPTAPVVTVRPNKATSIIPALSAGEELIITSYAGGEGSGQPNPKLAGTTEYFGRTQIIKATFAATGTAQTDQTWLQLKGVPGNPYYVVGQEQTEYRLAVSIDGALLVQETTDNPNAIIDPSSRINAQVLTTQGLIPTIRERGNVKLHTPGTWTIYDFDEIDRIMEREGGSQYVMTLAGLNWLQENNNVLVDFGKETNMQIVKSDVARGIMGGNGDLEMAINFTYLKKNDRVFMFNKMGNWSNPKSYGNSNYQYANYAIMMPVTKFTDPKSGKVTDNISLRYKGFGKYSRMLEMWKTGGAGDISIKTDDVDITQYNWRSNVGAQHKAVNQFIGIFTQ